MLLFVHGMWCYPDVWDDFIDYFEKRNYECKSINLKEGMNLKRTFFDDYVKKVEGFVTKNDVVIGHSMGGLIAQKVAERANPKACIAICSAPPKGINFGNTSLTLSTLRFIPNIIFNKPFKPSYKFARKFFFNCLTEEEARMRYERMEYESAKVAYELAVKKVPVDEKKVKCPFLFIAGKNDVVSPPSLIKRIARKYNGKYMEYDVCHWIFKEWQKIVEGIQSFLIEVYK